MLSVTIQVGNMKELAALAGQLAVLGEMGEQAQAQTTKKSASKPVAVAPTPTPVQEPEVDLGFGAEAEAAPTPKKLTLEDVIEGFKVYAAANGRESAGKLLGKFGVKSVRDLKEQDFERVMKALAK